VNRTVASLLAAVVAAILWLVWNFEHEHTSIRAPWTGMTLVASALAFVAVGLAATGWRAVLFAVVAAAGAVVLVEPLVWQTEPISVESCDPGCISREAAVVIASIVAGALATLGIVLRRAAALMVRAALSSSGTGR
jgi:hypothetical protein